MNPNKRIDIRTKEGFSWLLKILALIFIVISFMIISEHPVVSAILSFTCLLILTARSGVEIDTEKKSYQEYMAFFYVIKMGKPVPYENIEGISIKTDNLNKKSFRSSGGNTTIYRAFLEFLPTKRVHLISDKNKEALLRQSKAISHKLNTSVREV